jgi:hypothetical protein
LQSRDLGKRELRGDYETKTEEGGYSSVFLSKNYEVVVVRPLKKLGLFATQRTM